MLEYINQFDGKNTSAFNDCCMDRYDQQNLQDVMQVIKAFKKREEQEIN